MEGPHDDKLQELGLWPMKGTFTVKLYGNSIHITVNKEMFKVK